MEDFLNVLEFPTSIDKIDDYLYPTNKILYKNIEDFISNNVIENNLIISLSGGVDSSVLIVLLKELKLKYDINIIAVHINYNNRKETKTEENFLRFWCKKNNFKFELLEINDLKRGDDKREFYEKYIRNKRYDFYKKIISKYNSNGIFLGHHLNDLQENIMCNILKGRNIFDLSVMKPKSIVKDVVVYRPFLNNYKKEIYDYAHQYNIPYFKDTTPEWSNRGKLRNKLFPLMKEIYGSQCLDNLLKIGRSSNEWKHIIDSKIINQFTYNNIQLFKKGVIINYNGYIDYPFNFWNTIFLELCHTNLEISMIPKNCLINLVDKLNSVEIIEIIMKLDWIVYLYNNKIIILYKKYITSSKSKICKNIKMISHNGEDINNIFNRL